MNNRIILPWPPKELSPNGRLHYQEVAKAKKAYRATCGREARAQGLTPMADSTERLSVALTFFPPDRTRRDLDNCLARMKSGLDGLADVLGVDDSKWSLTIAKADTVGGYVEVTVTEGTAA